MTEPILAINPATIAGVIEANINAYLLSFARLSGGELHDDPRLIWADSGIPEEMFNSVVRADLDPSSIDAEIETVLSHFRSRNLPVVWHIGPSSRPEDLDRYLLAHGMDHSEDEPGMAVGLDSIRDDFPSPSGLTIETVTDLAGLAAWVDVWGCGAPEEAIRHSLEAYAGLGLRDDLPWRFYLGRIDGKPVATSKLFAAEGAVSVQYVVTLPELRRQGIGTAMTLHVLHEADALGYRVAVLTASPDGLGSYRRIGFREYCEIRRYSWGGTQS